MFVLWMSSLFIYLFIFFSFQNFNSSKLLSRVVCVLGLEYSDSPPLPQVLWAPVAGH